MVADHFARLSHILVPIKDASADVERGMVAEQKMRDFMALQSDWAAGLLRELAAGQSAGSLDRLNPSVLNSTTALAFVNSRKGDEREVCL
jgi:hypothetical protein